MTDHLGQGDKSASRREIGRWMLTVALLLMGVAISLDIELHVLAGSVLLVAAALTIVVAYRLDRSASAAATSLRPNTAIEIGQCPSCDHLLDRTLSASERGQI